MALDHSARAENAPELLLDSGIGMRGELGLRRIGFATYGGVRIAPSPKAAMAEAVHGRCHHSRETELRQAEGDG
jgi:hypothetical protein